MISKAENRSELLHEMVYLSGKELKRVHADKIKDEKAVSLGMDWAYLGDKYFITAVIPSKASDAEIYSKKLSDELYEASIVFTPLQIKPGETKGMYEVIPNYGVVVILLTVLIKIIFWPLSQKSYKSMKDMQKLAPLMEQIREKYKDDKERLNKEVMDLYKRHKVNPLGGCLPMILQIPVFFALYAVLGGAVELRHAPFILWITDLSTKDPYYVTPLIMGATMFIQQKMTPSAAPA